MTKALVVLSGGQDSTTCLYAALANFDEVHAITFDYGQRHSREIDQARLIVAKARSISGMGVMTHEVITLGDSILKSTSPLVSGNTLEQYENYRSLPGGIEKTFVPMRNQLFLTIAANRAYFHNCQIVVTGVCQEDYGGYPDCRQRFIEAFKLATAEGSYDLGPADKNALQFFTPLMNLTKAQTVEMAVRLENCYGMLAYTHTAYDGQYPPIGKDHATLLREKGFAEAGIPDPLILRAYMEGHMSLPYSSNYHAEVVAKWTQVMMDDLARQQ
jgi:7-cyano-7-deazaguanine synthase